jgi:hypothetical protein
MILKAPRAVAIAACAAALMLPAVTGAQAQRVSGAEPCRQGLLALIVMIEAEVHDPPHYQNKAKEVVESCGRPIAAGQNDAAPGTAIDAKLCGALAAAMFDGSESGQLDSPPFVKARDEFAARCMGAQPKP